MRKENFGIIVPNFLYKGNTPTHVGKTFKPLIELFLTKKHPHARGENPNILLKSLSMNTIHCIF